MRIVALALRRCFIRQAIIGLAAALFIAACASTRPLVYTPGAEPRIVVPPDNFESANAEIDDASADNADLAIHLPQAGDVLMTGGFGASRKTLKTAEFYDPSTGKFTLTSRMPSSRAGFGAVSFAGGALNHQVMVAGGASGRAVIRRHSLRLIATALSTAATYDPATGKFSPTAGDMAADRGFFTTTPLNDGTVLIAGGIDSMGTPLNSAEIFDPSTGTFTPTNGSMSTGRAFHTATLLNDGTVLVAGGISGTPPQATWTTEIYDPATGMFSAGAAMLQAVAGHTATLISGCGCAADGDVVIGGGFSTTPPSGSNPAFASSVQTVQIYNPSGPSFSYPANFIESRSFHSASLLANGKILFAGGLKGFVSFSASGITAFAGGGARNTAEIFDPSDNSLTCVNGPGIAGCNASMVNARAGHTATMFASGPLAGEILLAGGVGGARSGRGTPHPLATAELYNPATGATGAFAATGRMRAARVMQQAGILE